MGYGKIYETTWWGFSNPSGFGSIYDELNKGSMDEITLLYYDRVIEDGGKIESIGCVSIENLTI